MNESTNDAKLLKEKCDFVHGELTGWLWFAIGRSHFKKVMCTDKSFLINTAIFHKYQDGEKADNITVYRSHLTFFHPKLMLQII